jgi:hypothetical protein
LAKLKKYRALSVIAAAMFFNLIESIVFAKNGSPFNLKPLSVGEWICDIISTLIFIFGVMMATYDLWNYKPKIIRSYKVIDGEITEITVEE